MNYSRKDYNTIISFLEDNDEDFDKDYGMYLDILTIDDYARRWNVKDVWKDLCGMSEGGCANVWVVYDDGEKLVLGGVRTIEERRQFYRDYPSSHTYIVMNGK
jgi:hypothetical protein